MLICLDGMLDGIYIQNIKMSIYGNVSKKYHSARKKIISGVESTMLCVPITGDNIQALTPVVVSTLWNHADLIYMVNTQSIVDVACSVNAEYLKNLNKLTEAAIF
jgi:hypothetical protein